MEKPGWKSTEFALASVAFLVAVAFSFTALAEGRDLVCVAGIAAQAQTEPGLPSEDAGVVLRRTGWVRTFLKAPDGQTFTGTGWVRAWVHDPDRGWSRSPRDDEDLVDFAGLADFELASAKVGSERGRFAWLLEGVGLSGAGGDIEIDMMCSTGGGDAV